MATAQDQYNKLNKKMVKSYFGNVLRNMFRKSSNHLAKTLQKVANNLTKKERNPKRVLKNYDEIAGVYVSDYNEAFSNPKEILVLENNQPTLMSKDTFLNNKIKYLVEEVCPCRKYLRLLKWGQVKGLLLLRR